MEILVGEKIRGTTLSHYIQRDSYGMLVDIILVRILAKKNKNIHFCIQCVPKSHNHLGETGGINRFGIFRSVVKFREKAICVFIMYFTIKLVVHF